MSRLVTPLVATLCVGLLAADGSAQSGSSRRNNRRNNQQGQASASLAWVTRPAATDASEVLMPRDARLWHNSPPLSIESLTGKGVVFYFFEEESERLAGAWPNVQTAAAALKDEPVLFVAVNSGTDPRTLKRYLGRYRVGVPVIHDLTREFEAIMGVEAITPGANEYAVRYVTGEGSIGSGQGVGAQAIASAIEQAKQGAEWRVDPKLVPGPLRGAWRSIELGDFSSPAKTITRAAEKEGPTQEGAKTLLAAVQEEADQAFETAVKSEGDRRRWNAYQSLSALEDRFKGYEFKSLTKAEDLVGKLAKMKEVKNELAAAKLFASAVARGSASNLRRVASKYPGTEAAERAEGMLAGK